MIAAQHLWTIVLAAGDGSRLRSLSIDEHGTPVPKQFWRISEESTMLQWSLDRAARWTHREQTVAIVAAAHRAYWERELSGIPERNVIVQPDNRGTAAGILLPLLHVVRHDRQASVVIMPSDHHVGDEDVLEASIRQAVTSLDDDPYRVTLLGITPEGADPELGYIVPGDGLRDHRSVEAFVEKPSRALALRLLARGAVWNSFIFVARGAALLNLFAATEPELIQLFLEALEPGRGHHPLEELYRGLPVRDFSRDVCQRRPDLLRVLPVPRCGWTDLGTPPRVRSWRASLSRSRAETRGALAAPGKGPRGKASVPEMELQDKVGA